jgi:hypothetical protein
MDATADISFFLSRCEREFTATEIILTAANKIHADGLRRCCTQVARWALSKGRDWVIIQWAGDGGKPYRIPSWYASMESRPDEIKMSINEQPSERLEQMLVIPELGLDFNGIYYNEHPILFYDFEDGDIIFANLEAVRAQQKKAKQLIGSSGASLNFPEEFERRVNRVWQGEQLRSYENEAMRWWREPDSGIYRRKRMQFVSNAGKTNFLGTECWYSHTVSAVDTGRFVG